MALPVGAPSPTGIFLMTPTVGLPEIRPILLLLLNQLGLT